MVFFITYVPAGTGVVRRVQFPQEAYKGHFTTRENNVDYIRVFYEAAIPGRVSGLKDTRTLELRGIVQTEGFESIGA